MKSLIAIKLPFAHEDVIELELINRVADLIISPYDRSLLEPYSLEHYLKQKHVHKIKIHALLDRNITSELTKLARNGRPDTPSAKNVLSLLAFLQLADVDIEPGISLAEYSTTCLRPTPDNELFLFRKIDNLPTDYVIDLALSREYSLDIEKTLYKDDIESVAPVKSAEDVHLWKMHYTFSLKMYLLANSESSRFEKINRFMYWAWKDFLMSSIAISYISVFFSQYYGGMLKGVNSNNMDKVLHGIRNAAWDMTTANYWSKSVAKRNGNEPFYIFCTADKALKEVTRNILDQTGLVDKKQHFNNLFGSYLTKREISKLVDISYELENRKNDPQRNIVKFKCSPQYFEDCLKKIEEEVIH